MKQSSGKKGDSSSHKKPPQINSSDLPHLSGIQQTHNEINKKEVEEGAGKYNDEAKKKYAYFEVNKKLILEIWKKYHRKLK